MKFSRVLATFALTLAAGTIVLLSGCGSNSTGTNSGKGGGGGVRINAGGSTFVNPMMTKWADVYDKQKGVRVDYSSTGSGNGIQQMVAKTIDFGCTDGPLNDAQLQKAQGIGGAVVHIPIVMGAVVPAYNLPGVTAPVKFSGPVLADIYLGKIKKWNDPALTELNPDVKLPDQDIAVVYRSEGSGTTYVWVDYLSKVSAEWKDKVGVGTSVSFPMGTGQRGNEGVSGQVVRVPNSIGYTELTYAIQKNLRYGSVQNKEGEFVVPSLDSVSAAANNSLGQIQDDFRYSITNADGKNSYPISGTVWAVLYADQTGNSKGKDMVDFLRWVLHEGQNLAKDLQYARLPPGLVERADKKLNEVKFKP